MARKPANDSRPTPAANWVTADSWLESILAHPLFSRENVKGFITKDELSEFLNTKPATLDQWASRGNGPNCFGVGNHRKYWPSDVIAWLKTCRREFNADGERTVGAA